MTNIRQSTFYGTIIWFDCWCDQCLVLVLFGPVMSFSITLFFPSSTSPSLLPTFLKSRKQLVTILATYFNVAGDFCQWGAALHYPHMIWNGLDAEAKIEWGGSPDAGKEREGKIFWNCILFIFIISVMLNYYGWVHRYEMVCLLVVNWSRLGWNDNVWVPKGRFKQANRQTDHSWLMLSSLQLQLCRWLLRRCRCISIVLVSRWIQALTNWFPECNLSKWAVIIIPDLAHS